MRVFGLTGNIACGKSLVEQILQDAGIPVIDTDQVAREVVMPGSIGLDEIRQRFGSGVIAEDGTLDRAALGTIVFSDTGARRDLEAITHPKIFQRTGEQVVAHAAEGHELVIVSAALMVETGSYKHYAGMLVVTCPAEQQLARLLARDGFDRVEAIKRIDSQLPQLEKAALADVVFDNGGTVDETKAQVLAWLDLARADA